MRSEYGEIVAKLAIIRMTNDRDGGSSSFARFLSLFFFSSRFNDGSRGIRDIFFIHKTNRAVVDIVEEGNSRAREKKKTRKKTAFAPTDWNFTV